MWRTRVGYAGGTKPDPTYGSMGDHTESFQVDFDPQVVSYDDLLEMFWTSHDPTHQAWKTQYASLILAHDEEQLKAAEESRDRFASVLGRAVATRVERLDRFWLAEEYHQKYYLRNERVLMKEFEAHYPSADDLRESTSAARVNGYLLGVSGCVTLERDLPGLGLSKSAEQYLREICRG